MDVHTLELFHVEVPTQETFHPAWLPAYPQTENRFTLLKLATKDGRYGVAAGPAFSREREGLGDLIGPYLVGLAVDDLATVRQRIREASYLGWSNPWIEMAFLDLLGKLEGKAVCELLGGRRRRLPIYASTGETTTEKTAADQVATAGKLGADLVKLRAHAPTLEEDQAMLAAAAEAAADQGVELAVDANQGWFVDATGPAQRWDLGRAKAFAQACGEHGVSWLEEPLDMHDLEGMAGLREASPVPIAGAELIGGWHAIRPLFEHGCLDKYQPDAVFTGVEAALQTARRASQEGLSFAPHAWTNGWGLLLNAHILAASGFDTPLEWPFNPPGWTPEVRDGTLNQTLHPTVNGELELPDGPGLGVGLDEDELDRYGTRFYKATPGKVAWNVVRDKGLKETLKYAWRRRG